LRSKGKGAANMVIYKA